MRLPISAKTLFRLHRKLFMLRRPRPLCRHAISLSYSRGGKTPLCQVRIEKKRLSPMWLLLSAAAMTTVAMTAATLSMPHGK